MSTTITLTLLEKKPEENVIKISYKGTDGTDKEIRLTGDQAKDNDEMIKLFAELLPATWIEQYTTITSSLISSAPAPALMTEAQTNAKKLADTKSGRFYSDQLPIGVIVSALSTNKLSITKFNIYVIKTLLNKLTSRDYSKNIKKEILTTENLKKDFDDGFIIDSVKTDILSTARKSTYDNNNYNWFCILEYL